MAAQRSRHNLPRFWDAVLGLLAGTVLVVCLGAGGVALLFFFTSAANASRFAGPGRASYGGGIPVSSFPVNATPRLVSTNALPTRAKATTPTRAPTSTPTSTPTATSTSTPTVTFTPTSTATNTPIPPTPTPSDGLPYETSIAGVVGHVQALPLTCESRSAVDWARFFGVSIPELDFQAGLPLTDNPNTGFVGDPHDPRGKVPPASYGVHPPPVAALLRSYGVPAQSYAGYAWQDIRREVAAGRPVIAWVIGNVWLGGRHQSYTPSDGETLVVAPYEHTVIVTGYTPNSVIVVDNDLVYSVPIARFLDSWSVLGNLIIVFQQ